MCVYIRFIYIEIVFFFPFYCFLLYYIIIHFFKKFKGVKLIIIKITKKKKKKMVKKSEERKQMENSLWRFGRLISTLLWCSFIVPACYMAYNIRLYAINTYGRVIHSLIHGLICVQQDI